MSIFGGNCVYRSGIGLKFRMLLMPWIRRNSVVRCLKGNDYGSSYPVRYVPKTSSNPEEARPSYVVENSKNKEKHNFVNRNARKDELLDGRKKLRKGFGPFSSFMPNEEHNRMPTDNLSELEEVEEEIYCSPEFGDCESMEGLVEDVHKLRIHLNEPDERVNIHASKTKLDIERVATKLLGARAFTVVELRKKLYGKRFPLDIVDAVITDFQSRGFINDCLYAEIFSRSRWSSSGWGPRRIKQALLKKGVSAVDAEKAVKLVFEENETSVDDGLIHGLSKASMDNLIMKASKQWLRGLDVPREKQTSRIIRWLQYRGFDWGVIKFVLTKLEVDYPP